MGFEEMVLRRLGIRLRLAVAFGTFTLLLAAMAGVGAWRLAELHAIARDMSGVNVRMAQVTGQWLAETQTNLVRSVVLTHSDDPQLHRMLEPAFNGTAKRIDELAQQVEGLLTTPQSHQLFEAIAAARKNYVDARKAVVARKAAGDAAALDAMMQRELVPAGDAYLATLDALRAHYAADVEQDARDAADSAAWGQRVLAACCAAGLLLSILAAWLITRSITRPLDHAVATVGRVANGDLTVRVQEAGSDEVGRLLAGIGTMSDNLRTLVGQVAGSAHTVAETSAQIAQGNGDLSQRTEEQASTLEETASSMEELTSAVAQNAQTAAEASQLAGNARALAQDGGQAVAEVVGTMNAIAASSGRISEITSVIDGIAFQTNILALNAAVEAARAGTQGRGFAVVAAEVRTLAQRSGEAAREIRGLITEAARQVTTGTQQADAAGRKMHEIVAAVVQVSERFTELASSSEEQSSGIEQINTAITQMEQVVQQNATLVEEGAAATQALSGNAAELLALVQRFKVDVAAQRAAAGTGSLSWSRAAALPAFSGT